MANPVGRPMKYKHFLTILEDKVVYTPAKIVSHGEDHGLMNPLPEAIDPKRQRLRIRHTLARFSANHKFPKQGDGWVYISGQPPMRGWFGWRWKKALPK